MTTSQFVGFAATRDDTTRRAIIRREGLPSVLVGVSGTDVAILRSSKPRIEDALPYVGRRIAYEAERRDSRFVEGDFVLDLSDADIASFAQLLKSPPRRGECPYCGDEQPIATRCGDSGYGDHRMVEHAHYQCAAGHKWAVHKHDDGRESLQLLRGPDDSG